MTRRWYSPDRAMNMPLGKAETEDQLPQKLPLDMLRGMKGPLTSGVRLQKLGSADEATGQPAKAPGALIRRWGFGPQW